ncbi:helix-turn-helix transcriptional regulator [Corynebacterium phocae]|uniref:helix-turn-helix transcriptional regulator n=1 Tax=Corynebacterium phocae TaxID=161895 RepID=UPI0009FBE763|nr:helix-turn-helix domain-containing protein [Corynebacterium phocae]KAA8723244.1 helix-turn-helix domain-containing protein [Corynebacterium phocae]
MSRINAPEGFMTEQEACDYLGVTRNTLYKFRKTGRVAFHRLGPRRVVYRQEDLDRFIQRGN